MASGKLRNWVRIPRRRSRLVAQPEERGQRDQDARQRQNDSSDFSLAHFTQRQDDWLASGKVNQKVDPSPGALCTPTAP